ncbi:MmcQ/YjbR family DNA-binding protein [Jannaschia sp. R86511]|uniref:MmcQ/YjbR family DNA-binding protein n=1 Tax=Jannaschia sp. R86511 TaxID=3093853 RepID=UPI0036D2B4E1
MERWTEEDLVEVRDRVDDVASTLPGTVVQHERGHTRWFVRRRRFAWLLVDHHGDGRLALAVRAVPGQQSDLVRSDPDRWFVPAYLGARGWVAAQVDPGHEPDWDHVEHLLVESWRLAAGARDIARFDAGRAAPPA